MLFRGEFRHDLQYDAGPEKIDTHRQLMASTKWITPTYLLPDEEWPTETQNKWNCEGGRDLLVTFPLLMTTKKRSSKLKWFFSVQPNQRGRSEFWLLGIDLQHFERFILFLSSLFTNDWRKTLLLVSLLRPKPNLNGNLPHWESHNGVVFYKEKTKYMSILLKWTAFWRFHLCFGGMYSGCLV